MKVLDVYSQPSTLAVRAQGRPRTRVPPQWLSAAGSGDGFGAPVSDLADPGPAQGSDDEVWMVSYMDIMTLLLTLFVLLFAYAQAVSPESATERTQGGAPRVEAAREMPRPVVGMGTFAVPEAERPVALPPQWLGSIVEPPIPELMVRFGGSAVDAAVADAAAAASEASVTAALAPMGIGADSGLVAEKPAPAVPAAPGQDDARTASSGAEAARVADEGATDASRASSQLARATPPTDAAVAEEPAMRLAGADGASRESPSVAAGLAVQRSGVAVDTLRHSDRAPVTTGDAAAQPGRMEEELMAAIRASELGRRVEVTRRQDAVNLEIGDEILFDRGSAEIKPGGAALLAELAKLLRQQAVTVSVEGHTDDVPIRNARFASNWELSAARATTVTRQLVADGVDPTRLRAIGHANTKPRGENGTAEGRARNRRVTLVLHVPTAVQGDP